MRAQDTCRCFLLLPRYSQHARPFCFESELLRAPPHNKVNHVLGGGPQLTQYPDRRSQSCPLHLQTSIRSSTLTPHTAASNKTDTQGNILAGKSDDM